MLETLLITWRESLEAALIVGILLTYLGRRGQRAGVPYVWAGTAAAVLAALGCAAASNGLVACLDADVQELVQVAVLVLAVGVLTWMVLWMHRHARAIRGNLERRAGAGLAVGTAWLFFRGFRFLDLQTFFRATGVLLLLVAAGLLTSAINKLIGLGYLSPLVPQVWNTGWLVRDDSPLGRLLAALVGYRSRPSLLEVLAYCAYFPPVVWALRRAQAVPAGRSPR